MFGFQSVQMRGFGGERHHRCGRDREIQKPPRVPRADRNLLLTCCQVFQPKLADRLQHAETRRVGHWLSSHQARLDQRLDHVEDITPGIIMRVDHGLGRLDREPAGKDRQATKECLLLGREEGVGPGNRRAHRLLAGGEVTPTAGEQRQPLVEAGKQGGGRQDLDPRGGQFDGERETIEPAADGSDRRGIVLGHGEVGADGLRPRR